MGMAQRRRRLPLVALVLATTVSLVGSRLTLIALPWFVLQTTGSPAETGLVGAAAFLPALAAGVLGGAVIDRLGYKGASVATDVVSGLAIAAVPLLYQARLLAFPALLGLVLVGALPTVPGLTARRAMLPELASRGRLRLEQVSAAFEGVAFLAQVVGPALAGWLIARLGAAEVLWLDGVSFAVSALLVGLAIPGHALAPPASDSADGPAPGPRARLAAGLRYLRADHLLRLLALTLAASNLLSSPLPGVVLPVYVAGTFADPGVLGLLGTALGSGSLAGALGFGALGHRLARRPLWVLGYLVFPLDYWVLLLRPPLPLLALAFGVSGVFGGIVNPLLVTVRHERIPAALRAQVFGTFSALALAGQPLGIGLAGLGIEHVGFAPTVLLLALGSQAVGVGFGLMPTLRQMDRPAAEPSSRPPGRR
jgi:MFS family permease